MALLQDHPGEPAPEQSAILDFHVTSPLPAVGGLA